MALSDGETRRRAISGLLEAARRAVLWGARIQALWPGWWQARRGFLRRPPQAQRKIRAPAAQAQGVPGMR